MQLARIVYPHDKVQSKALSMSTTQHLLVVEDDAALRTVMCAYLETAGYQVIQAETGAQFHAKVARHKVDLIILDLELPDEDGLVLARQVRSKSNAPIIMVTSRATSADKIAGLEIGADDYVTKPFDPKELVLRINNILKRSIKNGKSSIYHTTMFRFGGWILDITQRTLENPDGEAIHLTRTEFDIMTALVSGRGKVKSRGSLLDAISYGGEEPTERAIDIIISRLRKKIEADPKRPSMIITIQGVGYRFMAKVE